ncbi:extracellular solute-binding protein [Saccharibacillus sp. CPCC 101409]|uniref:extracellular solute-binding protein n=1 Tax=Saccharibacillus sp. CPCC 101409 TaxID=3058041 RepID=UPI002671E8A3|nr:extracellular solute-binding protein [Saccharibacillus sp. CPCC 101409]MDO3411926.1 extracellular solute-binding protein [Saccharibacillus sp. CPCC 101409]
MKKRIGFTGLTALMLAASALLSGCGGSSEESGAGKATDTNAPMTVTIANNWGAPEADNNFVQKYLEQKFNIKIKNVKFETETWKEQLGVMLASGDIPDILAVDGTVGDMVQWADQGVIANISVDEIKQYMPKYTADVEGVDPKAWEAGSYNDKNWGVPKVWSNGSTGFMPAYNGQWLKAIGYDQPPQNLNELEDVLTKFTLEDPDGNGKKDTYGMTGRGKDAQTQMFNSVFAAYGVNPYQFKLGKDGKVEYGAVTEEARAALTLLNKWYTAGIIDPEFITDGNGEIQTKFISLRTGMLDTGMWHHLYKDGYFGLVSADKGIELVPGTPVAGPDGQKYAMSNGALQPPLFFGVQLEKDEAKRQKILEMLEYVATDDTGYLTTLFGEEGQSYDMQDGLPVLKEGIKAAEWGLSFYNPFGGKVQAMEKYHFSPDKIAFRDKYTNIDGLTILTDLMQSTVMSTKAQYEAILTTLQAQYYIKAITGEANTDKGFDDFKAQWLNSGGQAELDEAQQIYEARQG